MKVKERRFAAVIEYIAKAGEEYITRRKIVPVTNCNICSVIELADSLEVRSFKPIIEIVEIENTDFTII